MLSYFVWSTAFKSCENVLRSIVKVIFHQLTLFLRWQSIKPETQVFREGWKADLAKVTNVMDGCEIETLAWQLQKANNPLQVITRLADTVALLVRCQRFDRKQLVVLRELIGDSLS